LAGSQMSVYAITGLYLDGQPFTISGRVVIVGKQRGDLNADGLISISDAVALIAYIFAQGAAPEPLEVGDANCSGQVSVGDAISLISYIFASGPAPCP